MPRLSLYKPHKGDDYTFMDRNIREQFDIGGTAIHVHKYLGPQENNNSNDPSQPNYHKGSEIDPITGKEINPGGYVDETKIQDLLFMENRDRKYDKDIYELRGVYNVSDNDFDLSQFGLFLSNDVLFITLHINDMVEKLNRKLMPGDVIELPHLRDDLLLNHERNAINKFYTVEDASRSSEGYSQTWYPHIWRIKVSPLTDRQEFVDILGTADDPNSLKNDISSYATELNISKAVVHAAEIEDPLGLPLIAHLFGSDTESEEYDHGEVIAAGDQFPYAPNEGDYFIRHDFLPNRLFAFRGDRWHRLYDNVSDKTWSDRTYNAGGFVDNDNTMIIDNDEVPEKQALSNIIKPRSDFE
jgi:hypothetical protein